MERPSDVLLPETDEPPLAEPLGIPADAAPAALDTNGDMEPPDDGGPNKPTPPEANGQTGGQLASGDTPPEQPPSELVIRLLSDLPPVEQCLVDNGTTRCWIGEWVGIRIADIDIGHVNAPTVDLNNGFQFTDSHETGALSAPRKEVAAQTRRGERTGVPAASRGRLSVHAVDAALATEGGLARRRIGRLGIFTATRRLRGPSGDVT
jgi:hypothetical protein